MTYVILGLLLIMPMSQYDLIKAFQAGVSLFYSASAGSIKRALDNALESGLIAVAEVEATGRGRKVFAITPAGTAEFRRWMLSEITGGTTDTVLLSRLYFLGLVEPVQRSVVLDNMEARLAAEATVLHGIAEQAAGQPVPAEWAEIATFHRATLDYGLRTHEFARSWMAELRQRHGL